MEKYCQNPFCGKESTREVHVSVAGPSDETRSLCDACKVAFDWGVQHGRVTRTRSQVWVGAVTHQGNAVHAVIVAGKVQAVNALAEYLRTEETYVGPAELPGMCDWLAEHDERLGLDIFPASLGLR